jgi:hypothetical protein
MTNLKISIPSADAIREYDLERLEAAVEQHAKNIATFQQAIADEEARMAIAQSVVERKKELDRADSEFRQD